MEKLSLLETFHELYINLTAVVFNLVLVGIVLVQGGRGGRDNKRFLQLLLVILGVNLLSALSFFNIHVDLNIPPIIIMGVLLLEYAGNILGPYYFGIYIRSYSDRHPEKSRMQTVNRVVLGTVLFMLLAYFILHAGEAMKPGFDPLVHGWFRLLVGYVTEIYFLLYGMLIFRELKTLNVRAQIAVIFGFASTIFTVVLQYLIGPYPNISYVGASLGLMVFYFAAETPDYLKLQRTMKELETEKHRAEESRAQADLANRSKSEFLANMSHEIRTPINAILGMNEMILRESRDRKVTSYAKSVEGAGRSLLAIVNDILDFSKIEAGHMELTKAPYRLSDMLRDVCDLVLYRTKTKSLEFTVRVDESLPDLLYGDEARVKQIFINLLNNAVKYTQEGGVALTIDGSYRSSNPWEKRGEYVELLVTVRDTGIGIREEDLPKIFHKFERVDLEINNAVEGTGLGLAITENLLHLMHGEISVESAYGKGSTFSVMLPQLIEDNSPIGVFRIQEERKKTRETAMREAFRAPGARILVVDDTEMNLTVIEGLLKRTMVLLETVTGGEQALTLAADTAYDLIFLDQRMPRMDGIETLRAIRALPGGKNELTPVICLTADAVEGARERYLAEGFTDYLSKPVEGAALERALLKYLPESKIVRLQETEEEEESAEEGAVNTVLQAVYEGNAALDYASAERFLPTQEMMERTLREFAASGEDGANELEEMLEKGDIENFTIRVHALKSAARLIGATSLSAQAEYLEALGNVCGKREAV